MPLGMHAPADCLHPCAPLGCCALPLMTQVMFSLGWGNEEGVYSGPSKDYKFFKAGSPQGAGQSVLKPE